MANTDDFTATPVAEGGTLTNLDVLSNDTDDGSLDVTSVIITGNTNGVATANPVTGTVDFTHDGSDTTVASFTYTVNDDLGVPSNEATASLAVTPVNDPPVAQDDAVSTLKDTAVSIDVAANDIDIDAQP